MWSTLRKLKTDISFRIMRLHCDTVRVLFIWGGGRGGFSWVVLYCGIIYCITHVVNCLIVYVCMYVRMYVCLFIYLHHAPSQSSSVHTLVLLYNEIVLWISLLAHCMKGHISLLAQCIKGHISLLAHCIKGHISLLAHCMKGHISLLAHCMKGHISGWSSSVFESQRI